jgi:uracil-DNA glycosylase
MQDPPSLGSLKDLRGSLNDCRRCDLWRYATQGVPGEGPASPRLMLVGEQPGDSEDVQGLPFVGPAGGMLARALEAAGIDRKSVYVTNAVKHFKFEQRGRRRLHVKPTLGEIQACNGWLAEEIRLVQPQLIVALGTSAVRALLGRSASISSLRATAVPLGIAAGGARTPVWVTIHPSFLLRLPEESARHAEFQRFVEDLAGAARWVARH